MAFWFVMLIIVLIIPIFITYLGSKIFRIYKVRRDELEGKLGYRTAQSTKSDYSFAFAHHYFGSLWEYGGVAFAFVSGIMMLLTMGKSFINVSITAAVLILMQLAFIVASFVFTESALRTRFDEDGNPFDERYRLIEPPIPDVPEEEETEENSGEGGEEPTQTDGDNPEAEGEAEKPAEEENSEEPAPEGEAPETEGESQEHDAEYPEEGEAQEGVEPEQENDEEFTE